MKKIPVLVVACLLLAHATNSSNFGSVHAQSNSPFGIVEIGHLDTEGFAANLQVQDDVVFVSDSENGFVIINISNPESPIELSTFNEDIDHVHGMRVEGNYAYLADYTEGFKILDISDLENPTQIGSFHDGGEVDDFAISEDVAFLTDYEDGLEIVNITDPTDPVEICK
jgi:hypothetical protein